MKRKLTTLVAMLVICLAASDAQAQTDGFFTLADKSDNGGGLMPLTPNHGICNDVWTNGLFVWPEDEEPEVPELPDHGLDEDYPAPLDGGLLIFAAFGLGYAASKRRNRQD